ncbi:MAG: beta-phosphoglucomutase [Bacillaceae bacterium]
MKQVKAFIFDLDGVITDTAEYHYLAWKALGEELHIPFDREFNESLKGVNRMDSLERILAKGHRENDFTYEEKEALATKKNELYKTFIKQITPADVLPGVISFLKAIKEKGMKIGIASASKNAFEVIDRLEVGEYIDYIVDAATVVHGKPHPEVFMKAADALHVTYKDCVGIEDAEAGIEAINAAGMYSVGVGEAQSMAKANMIVENTSQLSLERIMNACLA